MSGHHRGRWGRLTTVVTGSAAILLGALVLTGWLTGTESLVRTLPGAPPMQFSSAVLMLLAGVGVLLADERRRLLIRALAILILILGGVPLVSDLTGTPLPLDRWLTVPWLHAGALSPGRTPPQPAIAFLLIGHGLLVASLARRVRRPSVWVGVSGTLAISLTAITAFRYLSGQFGLDSAPAGQVPIAFGTSAGISLLGAGLLALAARLARAEAMPKPSPWLPVNLALGFMLATGLVYQALELSERMHGGLPETVLTAGVLMALLIGYALRAKQLLEYSAQRINELNSVLERRVAQRTAELVAANRELAHEMAERERVANELAHLAKHDGLTGLPNRVLFHEHLQQALARAQREQKPLAVLFLDLDNFKDVNDTLGHELGDALLRQLAERLKTTLREADIVARLGGDEFVILAEDLPRADDCIDIAEKILAALRESFQLGPDTVFISTSIGIATFPDAGADPDTLIKHADSAMYQAKTEGRDTFALYSSGLHQRAMRRVEMKRRLHEALEREEFVVYYQPKVDLVSGRIVGAEALLRWREAGRMIAPNEFIPLTEETGLIVPIGGQVLDIACRDMERWRDAGLPLPEISVNVSVKQFRNNRLLDDLYRALEPRPELAGKLELELTERVFIEDSEQHRWLLREVEAMGLRISIDDFGTGCSSFSYFRSFPIHTVKIDGSFIRHVCNDSHDAKITETVLDLAQNFHLRVIAEGVETRDQLDFLRERRCDEAQGYYFSRPVPCEAFAEMWRRQNAGDRLH